MIKRPLTVVLRLFHWLSEGQQASPGKHLQLDVVAYAWAVENAAAAVMKLVTFMVDVLQMKHYLREQKGTSQLDKGCDSQKMLQCRRSCREKRVILVCFYFLGYISTIRVSSCIVSIGAYVLRELVPPMIVRFESGDKARKWLTGRGWARMFRFTGTTVYLTGSMSEAYLGRAGNGLPRPRGGSTAGRSVPL